MEAGISVLVFLEDKSIGKARKTINSVIEQNTNLSLQMLVCDMTGVFCEEIYQYDNYDVEYYVIENDVSRFDLEMNLRQQIKYAYYTMINDSEYWTDREYLQRAVDFLERSENYSMYGANAFIEKRGKCSYQLTDPESKMLYYSMYKKYLIHGIEDCFYNLDLDGKCIAWTIPLAFVCKNMIDVEALGEIAKQEENVKAVFTGKRGTFLLHIKEGMCLLDNKEVTYIVDEPAIPMWKYYINRALELYAIQFYFKEISPKRIWDKINISFLYAMQVLRQGKINEGEVEDFNEDLDVKWIKRHIEETGDTSPLWTRSYGGKNPDKVFLIMRMSIRGMGLFATLFDFIGGIEFAERMGAVSVIDLKNSYMMGLQEIEKCGKENAWEYYFEQPVQGYTLDEAYRSKNTMICDTYYWCNPVWYDMFPAESDVLHKWARIIKKYIRLKPEIEKICNNLFDMKLKDKKRVLGICVRNAFIEAKEEKSGLIGEHPVQASVHEFIAYIKRYMREWDCQYIYIVADDAFAKQQVIKEFGENCISMDRDLMSFFQNGNPVLNQKARFPKNWDIVKNNIDYICDTYLLSRCTSLLSGNCGCGRMAYYWNDGNYENVEVLDKGRY